MSKLSDLGIGTAQNQPVSAEVMEAAQEEMARLRVENARLRKEMSVLRKFLGSPDAFEEPNPLPRHQEPQDNSIAPQETTDSGTPVPVQRDA